MGLCVFVCGMCGGWSGVTSRGVGWGHVIGSLKTGFRYEIGDNHFEIRDHRFRDHSIRGTVFTPTVLKWDDVS